MDITQTSSLWTDAQLTQQLAEVQTAPYTALARSLFLVDTSVRPYADSYTQQVRTSPGLEAEIVGYKSALPNVLAFSKKSITSGVVPLGDAAIYDIQEIEQAIENGTNLNSIVLQAIVEGIYRKEDRLVFRGDSASSVYGIGNHPLINQVLLPATGNSNGYTATTSWEGKDIQTIVSEFGELLRVVREVAEEVGAPAPDTLILPSRVTTYLKTTFPNPANPVVTMWQIFTQSFPEIALSDSSLMNSLPLASLGGASNSAALLYNRANSVQVVIPRDVTLVPTQATDLKFSTPAHSRFGGLRVAYPEAVALVVGI
jgi:hypothetical protein